MIKTIATWLLTVPVFGVFLFAGLGKFGARATHAFQNDFGYSDEFRIFIGLAEVAGAIGVLVPRLAAWAAAGLVIIMAGAIYTHVQVDRSIAIPAVVGALCLGILALRYDRALFLTSAASAASSSAPDAAPDAGTSDQTGDGFAA